MKYKLTHYFERIVSIYDQQEALALCQWLFEEHFDVKLHSYLALQKQAETLTVDHPVWEQLDLLSTGKPIQQILAKAYFMDMVLAVNAYTLIPRPETEELVYLAQQLFPAQKRISLLDIGTGSGCIPIALARHYKAAKVYGLDVSKKALEIAHSNAELYQVNIDFEQLDVLKEMPNVTELDLIISNPPYIVPSEKEAMHENVLNHEPDVALFVPQEDPLLFYKRISELATVLLKSSGCILLEINPLYAAETAMLFKRDFEVSLLKDMQGKARFVKAIK
jgi:release factor glutamine methyltransferase